MKERLRLCWSLLVVCILGAAITDAAVLDGVLHANTAVHLTATPAADVQGEPQEGSQQLRPRLRKLLGTDMIPLDGLPRNPARDCALQNAHVAAAFGACQGLQVANATCCKTIDLTFGASSGQRSGNCLCLTSVLQGYEQAAPGFTKVLNVCKSTYGLQTAWASELGGICPALPNINDPYLWQGLAPSTVAFFMLHYLGVTIVDWLYASFSPVYRGLLLRKQRIVANNTYRIAVLSFALIWTMVYGRDLLLHGHVGSASRFSNMRLPLMVTVTLYMFELAYRIKNGVTIIVHHLVSVALILTVIYTIYDTRGTLESAVLARFSLLWLMHALLGQVADLGMILYHFQSIWAPQVLKVAALIDFTIRSTVHVLSWILYIRALLLPNQDLSSIPWMRTWIVLTPISDIALLVVQGHLLYIVLTIAQRARSNPKGLAGEVTVTVPADCSVAADSKRDRPSGSDV